MENHKSNIKLQINMQQEKLIQVAEDFVAGSLLQIFINLYLKSQEEWIPKERNDYINNHHITGRQFDRAVKILLKKDLILKKIKKIGNKPTLHIKLKSDKLLQFKEETNENIEVENHENTKIYRSKKDDIKGRKDYNSNINETHEKLIKRKVKNQGKTKFDKNEKNYKKLFSWKNWNNQ